MEASRLLAMAFGRRLIEGQDEWQHVSSVVRSSFLLLYGEVRRLHRQRHQDDQELTLLQEHVALVREELRLTQWEVQHMKEMYVEPRQCRCEKEKHKENDVRGRKLLRVVVTRQETLRRRVGKLQRRVTRIRRRQHDCEEIVVRAAEQQMHRLQKVEQQVNEEAAVQSRVVPRLARLETRVDATQEAVERCYAHQTIRVREKQINTKVDSVIIDGEPPIISAPPDVDKLLPTETDDHDKEPQAHVDDLRPMQATDTTAHTSLRRRYDRERTQQLQRLERLRQDTNKTGNNLEKTSSGHVTETNRRLMAVHSTSHVS